MMPDELSQMRRQLDTQERNQTDLAKSVTEIIGELNEFRRPLDELRLDRAARVERDKHLNERIDRLEKQIKDGLTEIKADVNARFDRFNKPIWIAVTALITTSVATIAGFAFRGGFGG